MKKILYLIIAIFISVSLILSGSAVNAEQTNLLTGSGTQKSPYIIQNVDDLLAFANSVNSGNSYEGKYILQTENINLEGIEWPSIGLYDSEKYFMGTYNGDGHIITNLNVSVGGNNSFFGQLGGTVMNLGIDSGQITGECVGGITSHSSAPTALIINCYNCATVYGVRAGGIADNFNGTISNCWTDCELISESNENVGGIVSYNALAVQNCISIEESGRSYPDQKNCKFIDKNNMQLSEIVTMLNESLYSSALLSSVDYHQLNFWKVNDENNQIEFSDEKVCFKIQYIGSYIKTYFEYIIPYLFIIIDLIIAGVIFIKYCKRRTN